MKRGKSALFYRREDGEQAWTEAMDTSMRGFNNHIIRISGGSLYGMEKKILHYYSSTL